VNFTPGEDKAEASREGHSVAFACPVDIFSDPYVVERRRVPPDRGYVVKSPRPAQLSPTDRG
jgi:hypothetical protein